MSAPLGLIRPARTEVADRAALVKAYLEQQSDRRFVFGTGAIARALAEAIGAGGFLDDHRVGEVVDGRPVLAPEQAQDLLVANGVILGRPRATSERIMRAGATPIDYLSFLGHGSPGIMFPVIGEGFEDEFTANRAEYEAIFERFADDESKETFAAIVNMRLHRDIDFMSAYSDRQHEQYFEPFLGLAAVGESFADVGSFDGATSRTFALRFPGYRHIHSLEPSPALASDVRRNLSSLRDVTVHEVGAGSQDGVLGFSPGGSASRIVEGGPDQVHIRRLDGLLEPAPTFIKMDIEGHEVPAIWGAAALIAQHRPVLAICCYHRIDDLRMIVRTVDDICGSYDLYLRHYTEGLTESVYFFIPR